MKTFKYLSLALIGFFGIAASARADHDSWWWHRHHDRVVVVAPRPVIGINIGFRDDYYRRHHHSLDADVQYSLARLGYYRGPIDGDIGPGSRAAIRAYQYDHGLYVNGVIDGPLVRSLGL